MTLVIDPFKADGYSMAEMTAAINVLPNMYGRINELNIFPAEGVEGRTVVIERSHGKLNLLVSKQLDAPPSKGVTGKRVMRNFSIPHYPHEDVILPSAVQSVRDPFNPAAAMTMERAILEKETTAKRKHDITLEFLRAGALAGILVDGDGSTLYNLYTEFSISEKQVDFVLGTSTTNIQAKCREVLGHIEDNLMGDVMSGVRVLVDATFFDKLIGHAETKDAYKYFSNNPGNPLRDDMRNMFPFAGLTFEQYRGTATQLNADGTTTARPFIAAGVGRAFPVGTMDTFATYFAPANMNETVNTRGLPYYARMEARGMGKGYDIYTESNPLPMCKRPEVLVKVYSSN